MRRSKVLYFGLLLVTVVLGLASRKYPAAFPAWVALYGGDALWAAMVFWLVALLWPKVTTARAAIIALAIAFAVECSQLFHAPWIDDVRASRLGALVLGQGFLWSDLVSYAAGVAIAAALDAWFTRRGARHRPASSS